MNGTAFFDTNIFIYTDDDTNSFKQEIAIGLVASYSRVGKAIISPQVLQEYFSIATKKLRMESAYAKEKVKLMAMLRVVPFSAQDVIYSIELHRQHQISFWDALIVHAARIGGAEILFSEDMQHGSRIAGVKIVNPFLESAAA